MEKKNFKHHKTLVTKKFISFETFKFKNQAYLFRDQKLIDSDRKTLVIPKKTSYSKTKTQQKSSILGAQRLRDSDITNFSHKKIQSPKLSKVTHVQIPKTQRFRYEK